MEQRTLTHELEKKRETEVRLLGWVNTRRDHGKIVFLDLRDRRGVVQVVAKSNLVEEIGNEDVVEIVGTVKDRPKDLINPKLATGKLEIECKSLKLISKAIPLPLPIDTPGYEIEEEVRLKYRYLDLRRERLTKNITTRSKFVSLVREFLFEHDFLEIETPILTKSTPEGSRDFIVPSRLHKGKFYALPQSPQQYKQLLMVAGFERYFQIARALRDEDLRADRGFEHTQIDIEMSFVKREDVMNLTEELMIDVFEKLGVKIANKPFPVFSYQEAMKQFGADKFDLRSKKEKANHTLAFAWVTDFPFFEKNKQGAWTYTHNPFSDPIPEHKQALLEGQIAGILTSQYDLICNGFEVGGGSIRSTDPRILSRVFEILGYQKDEINKKFGHMLEAFQYGVPPHGGIAPGVDRLMMCLLNEEYFREVVAFPMTSGGKTAVMDAPSEVTAEQLKELGVVVVRNKSE